jgi:hypothetical protein
MFEAMTNTLALSGGVFQQDSHLPHRYAASSKLETIDAGTNSVGFAGATRAPRVHDQIINSEQKRTFDFFAKRLTGLLQHHVIGRGKVDEIVAVNSYGREFGSAASRLK